jgi:hypothetical protein
MKHKWLVCRYRNQRLLNLKNMAKDIISIVAIYEIARRMALISGGGLRDPTEYDPLGNLSESWYSTLSEPQGCADFAGVSFGI